MLNKKIFFFILLFFPHFMFAAVKSSDVIWVWGNGDLMAYMLTFIYNIVNDKSFIYSLVRISALIGIVVFFIKEFAYYAGDIRGSSFVIKTVMFLVFSLALYGFFLKVDTSSKYRVYILNSNENTASSYSTCSIEAPNSECYAPIGIKLTMTFLTNLQKAILDKMDDAMMGTTVLAYSYNKSGLGFPLTFQKEVSDMKIEDVYKYQTFIEFYNNCLLFDFADGSKSLNGILKSGNLYKTLKSNNSRLTKVYTSVKPEGVTKQCFNVSVDNFLGGVTCNAVAKKLVSTGSTSYALGMKINFSNNYCDMIDNYAQRAFNERAGADNAIKQATAIKMLKMANRNLSFAEGTAIGDRELRFKWSAIGEMAKDWLPSIMGIMQTFVLGMIWLLPLISIATYSLRSIGYIIAFQAVLVIWTILLNLINFATISQLVSNFNFVMVDVLSGTRDGTSLYTLFTADAINEKNVNAIAFLGYMTILAFGIAMAVVGKSAGVFNGFISSLAQMAPGIHTISSAAKGGTSYGTTSNTEQGVASKNARGNYEKYLPDGSASTTNLSGLSTEKSIDNVGNIVEKETRFDGISNTKVTTNSGNMAGVTSDGNINDVKLNNGVSSGLSKALQSSVSQKVSKTMQEVEQNSNMVSNSLSNLESKYGSFSRAVSGGDSTKADKMLNNVKEQAYGQTLQDLASHSKKFGIAGEVGARVYGKLEAKAGFEILGNGASGVAGIAAEAGLKAQKANEFASNFQAAYAKNLSDKMSNSVSFVSSTSSTDVSSYANGVNDAVTKTNTATNNYQESISRLRAAEIAKQFVSSNGGEVNRDIATAMLQDAYDRGGMPEMKKELQRFQNPDYFQSRANDYVQSMVKNNIGLSKTMDVIKSQNNSASPSNNNGQNMEENDKSNLQEQQNVNNSESSIKKVQRFQNFDYTQVGTRGNTYKDEILPNSNNIQKSIGFKTIARNKISSEQLINPTNKDIRYDLDTQKIKNNTELNLQYDRNLQKQKRVDNSDPDIKKVYETNKKGDNLNSIKTVKDFKESGNLNNIPKLSAKSNRDEKHKP